MKRKGGSKKGGDPVAKRLKTLERIIKKEEPFCNFKFEMEAKAEAEHRETVVRLKQEAKDADAKLEQAKKEAEEKYGANEKRYDDASYASDVLRLFTRDVREKDRYTPYAVHVISCEQLWEGGMRGPEFFKVVNEVYGGVIPLDGYVPVVYRPDDSAWGIDYNRPVDSETHKKMDGMIYVERKGLYLVDYITTDFVTLPDDKEDEERLQELAQACQPHGFIPVKLFGLCAGYKDKKVKLEPPKGAFWDIVCANAKFQ
jgi:hypothetical protein